MAYDEELAARVRDDLGGEPGIEERRMFGGLAFLTQGRMAVAVAGQGGLMVRVSPDASAQAIRAPGVSLFRMQGRDLAGWLLVTLEAVRDDEDLQRWLRTGLDFARTLPPKHPKNPD